MVVGLTEDVEGNIWAACGRPRKLVRIRDFQVREVLGARASAGSHHLAAGPSAEVFGSRQKKRRRVDAERQDRHYDSAGSRSSPLNRHIAAGADGSVLVSSETGLVGWRAGKVQRMTTKNGLPCDFVIAFVQDKEKDWWLYTRCGVVGFSDAELQKWWVNPHAMVRNRVYDGSTAPSRTSALSTQRRRRPDGRVWFSSGVVVQMLDPSRISQPGKPAAASSVESVTVDGRNSRLMTGSRWARTRATCRSLTRRRPSRSRQKVRFRYKLDGYDDGWHEAGPRRQASTPMCPRGRHVPGDGGQQ